VRGNEQQCQVGEHRRPARVTIGATAESESDGAPTQETDQHHTGRESWFVEGTARPEAPGSPGPQRTIHEPARETPVQRHRLSVHRDHRSLLCRCVSGRRIHEVEQMLVIDPGECIDCSLCEPACPVSAITPAEGVAPEDRPFVAINATWPDGAEVVDRLVAAAG
jgi:NAD-dependent dihydropyrimidine dehydrogenase PreA subunit